MLGELPFLTCLNVVVTAARSVSTQHSSAALPYELLHAEPGWCPGPIGPSKQGM